MALQAHTTISTVKKETKFERKKAHFAQNGHPTQDHKNY
jgi:hypothetical protein